MLTRQAADTVIRTNPGGTLIGYFTLADPTVQESLSVARLLIDSGVDILETGWPSVRPYLDGLTIRQSHFRARVNLLKNLKSRGCAQGLTEKGWAILASLRSRIEQPLVFMGYREDVWLSPFNVLKGSQEIGIDALLIPDARKNEFQSLENITTIRVFDSAMRDDQVNDLALTAQGFGYVKTSCGLTGEYDTIQWDDLKNLFDRIRTVRPDLPLMAGFGLRQTEDIVQLRHIGFSGVVVGTAIVEFLSKRDWKGLAQFVGQLRIAME